MLTTDLTSRGLDIRAVSLIINYDVPHNINEYVHRSGRTARAGKAGTCLSIVTQYDIDKLKEIEGYIGQQMKLYKGVTEEQALGEMGKLDKIRRKLKIDFLVDGTDEKMSKHKIQKMKFKQDIKNKK